MTAGPVNSNEFTGTKRTRYFMQPGTTYQWNIRARNIDDNALQYASLRGQHHINSLHLMNVLILLTTLLTQKLIGLILPDLILSQ